MYKALDISNYIINKCIDDNIPISNMQLQKILYCIQRECLQIYKREMFIDEIGAWPFGPVVPEVYYRYCGFGANPIRIRSAADYRNNISNADLALINYIVEKTRILKPWALTEDVHRKGHAYYIIYNNGFGNHRVIPKDLIKKKG